MGNLDFGAAFGRVFDLYGKYAGPLLVWSAVVQVVISLLTAVVLTVILGGAGIGAVVVSGAAVAAIGVIATFVLTGAYIIGLDDAEKTGSFPGFGEVLPRVQPRLGALIGTSILAGLGILFGLILLVVPGLILLTWWAVVAPVVMLEDTSGTAALGRSRELVRGHGWTVFGLIFVVGLLTNIASGIIGGIVGAILGGSDSFLGSFGGNFVSGTILAPVSALLAVVMYEALAGGGGQVPPPPPAAPTQDVTPPADQSGPFV